MDDRKCNYFSQLSIQIYFDRYQCIHTYIHNYLYFMFRKLDFSIWSISEINIQPQDIEILILFQNVEIQILRKTQQCFHYLSQLYIRQLQT